MFDGAYTTYITFTHYAFKKTNLYPNFTESNL